MRLKGNISNGPLLHNVAASLEKIEKNILLMFFEKELIIHMQSNQQEGLLARCVFPINKIFSQYRMESARNNSIYIEIEASLLVQTIKSTTGPETSFKLFKVQDENFLRFDKSNLEDVKGKIKKVKQLPVRILSRQQMTLIHEPKLPKPTIQFKLPKLEVLRNELKRMKFQHHKIKIEANLAGEVNLFLRTESSEVQTTFYDCGSLLFENLPEQFFQNIDAYATRDMLEKCHVYLEMKDFVKIVNSSIVDFKYSVCSIVENHALYLFNKLTSPLGEDLGELHFYFPAIVE